MGGYTGRDFERDWIYDIERDFNRDGVPASWIEGHPRTWGTEQAKLYFESTPKAVAVNSANTLFAVGVSNVIHIFSSQTYELVQTFTGHTVDVQHLIFRPNTPSELVSYADSNSGRDGEIILWGEIDGPNRIDGNELTKRATRAMWEEVKRNGSPWEVDEDTAAELSDSVKKAICAAYLKQTAAELSEGASKLTQAVHLGQKIPDYTQIAGRITHFGGDSFDTSGDVLVYIPRQTNDIVLRDVVGGRIQITFYGHTDMVTWSGFSPDGKYVASTGWDKSVCVWPRDSVTAQSAHLFRTNGQNWTGGFTPDSQYIAAGSGEGKVFVWSVVDGSTVSVIDCGRFHWPRTLAFSPDGEDLAIGINGGRVIIVDPLTGKLRQDWMLRTAGENADMIRHFLEIKTVAYLPGGHKLAFKGTDGGVEVYDKVDNTKMRFGPNDRDHFYYPYGFSATLEGSILSLDADNFLRIWALPQSKPEDDESDDESDDATLHELV